MTRTPLYKYTGKNGTLITQIDLGIDHEDMIRLSADSGFVLTDGEAETYVIDIMPEDESKWTETPIKEDDENTAEVI